MPMIDDAAERRLARVNGRARASSERPLSPKVQAYLQGASQIARSALASPDNPKERRRTERLQLNSEVLVRRIGGFNFQVALKELSTAGCRVEMLEPCEREDCVIARFPHLEPLGSRVCWAKGTTTGLEFQTSLHPAVLELLLSRLSQLELAPT